MQTEAETKAFSQDYFYPEHCITVQASSQEEADAKLEAVLKEKNK